MFDKRKYIICANSHMKLSTPERID